MEGEKEIVAMREAVGLVRLCGSTFPGGVLRPREKELEGEKEIFAMREAGWIGEASSFPEGEKCVGVLGLREKELEGEKEISIEMSEILRIK